MIIAGVGSRDTIPSVLRDMRRIGEYCRFHNITVRSGHAGGADEYFEKGAQEACLAIYPWTGFNTDPNKDGFITNAKVLVYKHNSATEEIARKYHPKYDYLKASVKKLMCRNVWQVLGETLNSPVKFVVCWTEGAMGEGGTGQAIRVANGYGIPVYDMGNPKFNYDYVISELKRL